MNVSEHLAQNHEVARAHHTKMAKVARTQATLFRKMHKATGTTDDAETPASQLADQCDAQANLHDQAAAHHEDMKAACEKAAADLLNKLVPDQISGLAPERPALRAIPRAGAPPMGGGQRPNVEPQFAHLVTIEDD
jgi:hypothetical protein